MAVTLINPVGPEPKGVYWLRRLIVLGVVLLVLFALWFLLLRGRGDSSTPSGSSTAKPTVSPTGSASPKPSPSSSPTSGVPDCADSDISVSITLSATSVPAGSPLKLTQGITNSGSTPCRRDIGAKANTIIITSGGYPVWSSDDCSPGGDADVVTIKPGEEYQVSVTWKGQLTEGQCPANPPTVKAGGYDAQGKNGEVTSKSKPFEVT